MDQEGLLDLAGYYVHDIVLHGYLRMDYPVVRTIKVPYEPPRDEVVEPGTGTLFLSVDGEEISRDHLTCMARHYIAQTKIDKTGACHLFHVPLR